MRLVFTDTAWSDYLWFQDHDRKLLKRINALIKDVKRSPFEGIGKPEALKANLSGYWSRRITTSIDLYMPLEATTWSSSLPLPL